MGTGKSTVARALADVMGRYIPLDTDSIIEELLVATCDEIFATDGEEAFRSVESQVLDQVRYTGGAARGRETGGGTVPIFCLSCSSETIDEAVGLDSICPVFPM